MRSILLVLLLSGFTVNAEESSKTQADFFSPNCTDCPKMQTPGSANLGNNKGVFRPGNSKKKPSSAPPVDTDK